MPKTISKEYEFRRMIGRNLSTLQGGRTDKEMASIIGKKSPMTWAERKERPGTLTLEEVQNLCKCLKIEIARFLTTELQIS